MAKNPFRASLGATPPALVGRDDDIDEFVVALDNGPGTHERINVITGARGVGKTVLLNAFEDEAKQRGWRVFSETATAGFLNRLTDQVLTSLETLISTNNTYLSSFQVAGYGISFERKESKPTTDTLRSALTALLDAQAELDARVGQDPVGVLVTLDELNYTNREELIDFGVTIQHLVREDREIAVAMAGIPQAISPLLSSDQGKNPVTFLRRANRIDLGPVSDDAVRRGLEEPVRSLDTSWEPDALNEAVEACAGYPFMIQLVGQWCVHAADTVITTDCAAVGIEKAQRKLGQSVHAPALADLSDVDRTFLLQMSLDNGPSKMADIANRMGVSAQYANRYRGRLIEADMIYAGRTGEVHYSLPFMKDYLREHFASDLI